MPAAAVAAVATVGGAVLGANATKKAANTAASAERDAANQNAQLAREQRDMMRGYVDPLTPYAYQGASALAARLGLSQPGGSTSGTAANDPYYGYRGMTGGQTPEYTDKAIALPEGQMTAPPKRFVEPASAGPQTSGNPFAKSPSTQGQQTPDWAAYLQANPDVAEWAKTHGDPNTPLDQQTPEQRAAYQWAHEQQAYGSAPRPLTYTDQATGAEPQTTPSGPALPYGVSASDPQQPSFGPRPTEARPDQGTAPTFGAEPSQGDYFNPDKFHTDPGYEFALQQGLRSANAGYAAKGLLKSDAAIKGLNDYGQGMANQQYGNWWTRQNQLYGAALGQYNTDRNVGLNQFNLDRTNRNQNFDVDQSRADARYDSDRAFNQNLFTDARNFAVNRYDTQTADLRNLTNIGTGAINTLGGVGNSYVNTVTGSNNNAADATANAAIASANSTTNLFGNAMQGLGTVYGLYSKANPFSTAKPATTGSGLGTVNYGNSLDYGNIFGRTF